MGPVILYSRYNDVLGWICPSTRNFFHEGVAFLELAGLSLPLTLQKHYLLLMPDARYIELAVMATCLTVLLKPREHLQSPLPSHFPNTATSTDARSPPRSRVF